MARVISHAAAAHKGFQVLTTIPEQWDRFVRNHPQGTIYHSWWWLRLICETYRYQPLFVVQETRAGIRAGIPLALVDSRLTGRRLIAFAFSDSCSPLASDPDTSRALLQIAEEERHHQRAAFVEIRGSETVSPNGGEADYLSHQLSLEKRLEDVWSNVHRDCLRRRVEKAFRQGVVCETATVVKPEDVLDFYHLHSLTRRRQGVPTQPYRFFRSLFSMVGSAPMELTFASFQGQRVASVVVLYFGEVAYFKFGACDERFNSTGANQLIMWQSIRNAHARGTRVFDFGRTSVGNQGLREYKRRWGATERPLHYLVLPAGRRSQSFVETSRRHRLIKCALRRLPVWANQLVGECFYRHLG